MAFDPRDASLIFHELDEINARWRDLALQYREAGATEGLVGAAMEKERRRIKSLMDWEEHLYAEQFALLERAVNEYRPAISRETVRKLERERRGKLDAGLSTAQDALGRTILVQGADRTYGGLYSLANSVYDLIERLRRHLSNG